ncbi:hypothetical protein N9449_07355 [Oceanospirillaceae bacterium]|nr:hypothetical protein [Oceanospirillaceae bacterium]
MDKPWENDSCAAMKAHYEIYSTPKAAALWCGVPEEKIDEIVGEITQLSETGFGRGVYVHPYIQCVEPRSRAIAEALESGELKHGRENGKTLEEGDYAAPERRHFFGRDLKSWMEKKFPNEKPTFLFDEIDRAKDSGITGDDYLILKAQNEVLEQRLKNAEKWYKDHKPVPTQGHNAYREVIATLAELVMDEPLTGKPAVDARALIETVERRGKILPSEKTVTKYLTPS